MALASVPVQYVREQYLDLMERCLLNTIYEDAYTDWREREVEKNFDASMRQFGRDWPSVAHTMIGQLRLRNLRELAERVISEEIPGDFIETGVWRGGACIMLRAILKAHGVTDRRVFVADSYEGLPEPNADSYPADAGDVHHQFEELAVSLEKVQANFAKYGLLDEQVVFLKGWFKDTLPGAPVKQLAILRLDGDMYGSTMDGLRNLYHKVSAGGFVIVDDYGCVEGCREAIHEFRDELGISDPIVNIDGWGVYWRKTTPANTVAPFANRLTPISDSLPRPFWSVVIPLYERTQYLKQCMDSVLDQDPGPEEMEILVIDDASPTDLRGLVESLGRGRIRYIRNETNLGLYRSTNAVLQRTRGRWLHILHDDDFVLPGFYAKMRRGVESAPTTVGVAFSMYLNKHEHDGSDWTPPVFSKVAGVLGEEFKIRLASGNPLNMPAVIYRRETFEQVGLFRDDSPYCADWEWYVRAAMKVDWYHDPEPLACWRVHDASQSRALTQIGQSVREIRSTFESLASLYPPELAAKALPSARVMLARRFLTDVHALLELGNQGLALRFLIEALTLDPDVAARPEFIKLVQMKNSPGLRHLIREALLRRFS